MRITAYQRQVILESSKEIFGDDVEVRLFGSRADDTKKGGDIDLFVDLPFVDPMKTEKSLKFSSMICRKLGDLIDVDVVIKDRSSPASLIYQEGMNGVRL